MHATDGGGFGRGRPSDSDSEDPYPSLGMSSFHAVSGSQTMSYCVADEAAVNASLEQSLSAFTRPRDVRKRDTASPSHAGPRTHAPASTTPPATRADPTSDQGGVAPPKFTTPQIAVDAAVAALEAASASDTADAAARKERESRSSAAPTTPTAAAPSASSALHEYLSRPYTPAGHHDKTHETPTSRAHHPGGLSQPLTPTLLGGSGPASAFSGVSSRRNSLFSEPLSDEEEAEGVGSGPASETDRRPGNSDDDLSSSSVFGPPEDSMMDSGSAPQLVMPSIKMPSRRPFTDEGKKLGRLKLLVAGQSGVGKTALIKAIVQLCEHIVHVDPITPTSAPDSAANAGPRSEPKAKGRARPSSSRAAAGGAGTTKQIAEIYGSTKPYPDWWTDLADVGVQNTRRRKSLGDTVLDRNICFVDTPGFGAGSPQSLQNVMPVVQYLESHLERMSSNSLSDADLLNLLGGEGGSQVDAVLYLIAHDLSALDVQYLSRLAPFTNVIPLLAQADSMSTEQIASSKSRVLCQLLEAGVRPFGFSSLPSHRSSISLAASATAAPAGADNLGSGDGAPSPPFAVSSAMGSDSEVMDASLLMSPDYVEPLVPSELQTLVGRVFSADGASWLRHSAARKYLQWRSGEFEGPGKKPQALYRPLTSWPPPSLYQHHQQQQTQNQQWQLQQHASSSSALALAPLGGGAAETEQHLAQVRLANWAAELQRSLASERECYEALARSDRAVWLTERLGECVQDGTLVPVARRPRRERGQQGNRPSSSSSSGSSSAPLRHARHRGNPSRAPAPAATRTNATTVGASAERPAIAVPRPLPAKTGAPHHHHHHHRGHHRGHRHQHLHPDPLGLLQAAADLKAKGWVALEVLGGIGVLGGLALWVTGHYWHAVHPYDWLIERWHTTE